MNIVITGATGFIGLNLMNSLSKCTDWKVKVLVRSQSLNKINLPDGVECVEGDVLFPDSLDAALKGAQVLIHAAAATNPLPEKEIWAVNLTGTSNVIDAAKKAGVNRIIFVSTASVLSSALGAYEKSKLDAEDIVRRSGLDYIILRPTLVYGRGDTKNIGRIIKWAATMPVIPVIGDGKPLMQPVYIEDLTSVIKSLLKKDLWPGKAYSLAGSDRLSMNDCCRKISEKLQVDKPLFHIPYWAAGTVFAFLSMLGIRIISPTQIRHLKEGFVYDIRPAVSELGFKPLSFEQGLGRLFNECG